jgi:ribonuclease HII
MNFESQFISSFPSTVIASDEVGRGPLAGPVVACSVKITVHSHEEISLINQTLRDLGVNDSKKMHAAFREELANVCWADWFIEHAVCELSAQEIDDSNILKASLKAMHLSALECVANSNQKNIHWFIDGNRAPKYASDQWRVHPIIKGDSHSSLIGLASILAKVHRDKIMQNFHQIYPHYGFHQNAGYPTEAHRNAIKEHGPVDIHRRSFKGVREFL